MISLPGFAARRIAAVAVFILAVSGRPLSAQELYPGLTHEIDSLYHDFAAENQLPGGAVLVMKGDSIAYMKCFGLADMMTGVKITANTLLNLGSISKTFVANGILILQEEGKLSVADPVSKYFPGFKSREIANRVTVMHLLTHTSGLPDNRPVSENREFFITAKDYENWAPVMQAERLVFEPGSGYEYSNPAFNGLALIIEQVSGQKWQDFIAERIFRQAGMVTSTITDGPHPETGVAHAYEMVDGKWTESDYGEFPTFAAAGNGGVWSSVTELAMYEKAIRHNVFLGRELTDESRSVCRPENWAADEEPFIGYSWFIGEDQFLDEKNNFSVRFVYHTGDQGGFRAFFVSIPEKEILYVALFNRPPEDLNKLIIGGISLFEKNNWIE